MQLIDYEQLISGIVLVILGIVVIIKSRSIAKVCRENKIKLFGEASYDNISEAIARYILILIGVIFLLGSSLQVYQCFKF
jgi:hypothetical protein